MPLYRRKPCSSYNYRCRIFVHPRFELTDINKNRFDLCRKYNRTCKYLDYKFLFRHSYLVLKNISKNNRLHPTTSYCCFHQGWEPSYMLNGHKSSFLRAIHNFVCFDILIYHNPNRYNDNRPWTILEDIRKNQDQSLRDIHTLLPSAFRKHYQRYQ